MKDEYVRKAQVLRIIDGDTIEVVIDMGLSIKFQTILRMAGINAPEVVGASKVEGLAARDWLSYQLRNMSVLVKTEKPEDKYGRYLAWVYIPGDIDSINYQMVLAGFAKAM